MYRHFSKFIYHGSVLHYSVFGEGNKTLLMFHGYGQTLKSLKGIEELMSAEYRIFSFDLFFHGFSEWNHNDTPLSTDFWERMLTAFFEENEIDTFSLLGFSLGAKVALSTSELFPSKVQELYLIAPDGIKRNVFYNIATSGFFKGVFRKIILSPNLFHRMVKILSFLKIVDKSILRFASIQMNSREKRRRVYYTWTVYKGLKPHLARLISDLNLYDVKTEAYVGKYDRIIRSDQVKHFIDQLDHALFYVLDSGHNNLLEEVANHMEKSLSKR
jgi:pimeloyl-ACP methyl ester carboxylesterase